MVYEEQPKVNFCEGAGIFAGDCILPTIMPIWYCDPRALRLYFLALRVAISPTITFFHCHDPNEKGWIVQD